MAFFAFLMRHQLLSVIPIRRTCSNSGQLLKFVPWVRLYPLWAGCSVELCLAGAPGEAEDLPKSFLSMLYPRESGLSSLAEGLD